MLWQVRAALPDRPGALAALARACADGEANILGLQVFPGVETVTDELVLAVPDAWEPGDVEKLLEGSGATVVATSRCTPHALQDGPTNYLNAVRRLVDEPSAVGPLLAHLLGGTFDEDLRHVAPERRIALPGGRARGPVSAVTREAPFTETERARAAAFTGLADVLRERPGHRSVSVSLLPGPAPVGQRVVVRAARPADEDAALRMHQRCSQETLIRRYHSAGTQPDDLVARQLPSPPGGASVVADVDGEIVGIGVVAPLDPDTMEVAVVVEDGWQGRGVGSRLLHRTAQLAQDRGASAIVCLAEPDPEQLVRALARAGLRPRLRRVAGVVHVRARVRDVVPQTARDHVSLPA